MTTGLSRTLPLALLAIGALIQGCASGPEIRADANPEANFAQYRTFAFLDPLATDKAGYSSILTSYLKQAVRRELESRGYVYAETSPDLRTNFYFNAQEKQYVSTTPSASPYFGYRAGYYDPWAGWGAMYSTPDVHTYYRTEGTLTIDLIDTGKRQLVWQGSASGTIDDKVRANPGAAVDTVVNLIFAKYPHTAAR